MKGYWVCIYEKIEDEEKLKDYATKAASALEKYSGNSTAQNYRRNIMVNITNFWD